MIYTVKRIDEDLDFGCEERAEGTPVMAVVTLVDSSGEEMRVKTEDAMLYERNINDGNKVYFDEKHTLAKVLDEDWIKNCATKSVDTYGLCRYDAVGENWEKEDCKYTFCGGDVVLMKNEAGYTTIGCVKCDMRINLESN